MAWWEIAICIYAGILFIFCEGRKTYSIKDDAAVSVEKEKLMQWNRYHKIYCYCSGACFLFVSVCAILERNHMNGNFTAYPIIFAVVFTYLFCLKHLYNLSVFGKFFVGNILEEVEKDKNNLQERIRQRYDRKK